MRLIHSLSVPDCLGVDHMDFSADGRYAFASCEFAGRMIKVDLQTSAWWERCCSAAASALPRTSSSPPTARLLYVADQAAGGRVGDRPDHAFAGSASCPPGAGAHGLYPSRDASVLYVSNRSAGTISVVSFRTRRVVSTWTLPQPASPDMGGVSADGRLLWLSGRYDAVVYAIDTRTGRQVAQDPGGRGPARAVRVAAAGPSCRWVIPA